MPTEPDVATQAQEEKTTMQLLRESTDTDIVILCLLCGWQGKMCSAGPYCQNCLQTKTKRVDREVPGGKGDAAGKPTAEPEPLSGLP